MHFYNIDDLLMCTLPYHDSNIFIRVLQILNLSSPKSKWHWLEQVQKAGTHLPCLTMATHAYKDEGFLNFISSIPEQFIQVTKKQWIDSHIDAEYLHRVQEIQPS